MTDRLFNLIDKADAEFEEVNEFSNALIDISKHKRTAEALVELLHSAIVHHESFWAQIESSDEFKKTYANDRVKALKAYENQKSKENKMCEQAHEEDFLCEYFSK